MKTVSTEAFSRALMHVCRLVIASEPELTRLDNIVGDGDHGLGMKDGFTELLSVLQTTAFQNFHELTRTTGMALVKSMGGASGVIFGTLFIGGHDAVVALDGSYLRELTADDLRKYFRRSAEAISHRGRAQANDRTMLDALLYACQAMEDSDTDDVTQLLLAASDGAQRGVEATKTLRPRLGRSKNFREQAISWPDPGAVSTSIIFRGLWEGLCAEETEGRR